MTATTTSAQRPVKAPTATVSTLGFVGIIVALIAVGLGGVMIVTTSVGAQSKEITALRSEATRLGYHSAALESQLQRVSSANMLALRASQLGMVPNPYPAFIDLVDGTITGEPTKVTGNELPMLRGQAPTPEPSPTPVAPATPAPTPSATAEQPTDLVAAGEIAEGA